MIDNASHNVPREYFGIKNDEFFAGHKACQGCGASLVVRLALKALGARSFSVLPAGCMSAVGFVFPQMAFASNAIISTFAGTASMLSGLAAGARACGIKDFKAVGFAGDGATADIGIGALSAAIDRHEDIIYICYDNEAYMNTGIQKSALTPFGASTTTSPPGPRNNGAFSRKKDMFEIVAAHRIDYAATASIGHYRDFIAKVKKAATIMGTSYLHVLAPCPTGWGYEPCDSLTLAREAVQCGLWYLAEYQNDIFTLNNRVESFKPVADYLGKQKRFRHLSRSDMDKLEKLRDEDWQRRFRLFAC